MPKGPATAEGPAASCLDLGGQVVLADLDPFPKTAVRHEKEEARVTAEGWPFKASELASATEEEELQVTPVRVW